MTYDNIYKKFMIEYDKEIVTSSYPSLTKYEVATMLDKAYLALIDQKFTGNNSRGALFEQDSKAIEDLRPLITSMILDQQEIHEGFRNIPNAIHIDLPRDMMYYISANANCNMDYSEPDLITLTSHQNAQNFVQTTTNMPWIKNLIGFIEDSYLVVLYDPFYEKDFTSGMITYIRNPISFVNNIDKWNSTAFELSDSVAQELITLAKILALENVESQRLSTSIQTKQIVS